MDVLKLADWKCAKRTLRVALHSFAIVTAFSGLLGVAAADEQGGKDADQTPQGGYCAYLALNAVARDLGTELDDSPAVEHLRALPTADMLSLKNAAEKSGFSTRAVWVTSENASSLARLLGEYRYPARLIARVPANVDETGVTAAVSPDTRWHFVVITQVADTALYGYDPMTDRLVGFDTSGVRTAALVVQPAHNRFAASLFNFISRLSDIIASTLTTAVIVALIFVLVIVSYRASLWRMLNQILATTHRVFTEQRGAVIFLGIAAPVVVALLSFAVVRTKDVPRLVFSTQVYELGETPEGVPLDAELVLRNVSNQPLTVDRLVGDCGCVVMSIDEKAISAGGTTEVGIRFSTPRKGINTRKIEAVSKALLPRPARFGSPVTDCRDWCQESQS